MAVSSVGDVSLTALRESLVVGQAEDSEQGAPQVMQVSSVGDVSLTALQENLTVGQAEDSEQGAPQAITTGHFITEGVNDLLPLAYSAWFCIVGLLIVIFLIAGLIYVAATLMKTMWYLSYLLFLAFPPLGFAFKELSSKLHCQLKEGCTAMIGIRSDKQNKYLFESIVTILRRVTQSGEAELVVEREEKTVGTWSWQVILVPTKKSYSLRVTSRAESKMVEVVSTQADPVVCGPKHELVRLQAIQLSITSNPTWQMLTLPCRPSYSARLLAKRNADMTFLQNWIDDVYTEFMHAQRGTVEVLELQQDSKDWPPEWQSVRKETAVRGDLESSEETASRLDLHSTSDMKSTAYYFVQPWAERMKKHADFAMRHSGRIRTTLFLHGQKGSGKTLFVEWLASELGLPIYYIDLRASFLDDTLLRDALTPRKLRHDLPVIFHFDEFQSMIEAWADNAKTFSSDQSSQSQPTRVTIQGLQSVLEGISTPNNALFVFTGSRDLPELDPLPSAVRDEWEGVLRRFPVREKIPSIGRDAAIKIVSHFFVQFVPANAIHKSHLDQLVAAWEVDGEQDIPFDMASKYCQQRLRDAFIEGLLVEGRNGLCVPSDGIIKFVEHAFDAKSLKTWHDTYAGGKLQI